MHIAEATRSVNGLSTNYPHGLGHNGGPELYVREVGKLQAIDAVLRDPRYSQTEALILIGLIVRSDAGFGNAFPGASTLAVYAKVKKRDTVFAALDRLEENYCVIARQNRGRGRSNAYRILPQSIIEQVVEAHQIRQKTSPVEQDGASETSPAEQDGFEQELVPPNGTPPLTGRPTQQDATRPVERDATSPVERDTIHSLSIPVSNPSKSDERKNSYDVERVTVDESGRVQIHNGLRQDWVRMLGDETVLDAALMGVSIQKNGASPEVQVSRQLTAVLQRQRPRQQFTSARDAKIDAQREARAALKDVLQRLGAGQ